ncbi:MAG TPA: dUTP diphosphatase [Acidisarcina sp.]
MPSGEIASSSATTLRIKLLHPDAKPPTVNYAGSDIGYDLYSIEDTVLPPGVSVKVRTGIAIEGPLGCGFVLGDRSSMAARGITYAGGRIDAGYRGEIIVCLINVNQPEYSLALKHDVNGRLLDAALQRSDASIAIKKGDKIIQLSPFHSMTAAEVVVVDELSMSERSHRGFGSSGR